jgi:hypothetical protein
MRKHSADISRIGLLKESQKTLLRQPSRSFKAQLERGQTLLDQQN